jgi:hypothetical protein
MIEATTSGIINSKIASRTLKKGAEIAAAR